MRESAATQPLGAAALEEAQIGSVIDTTGKVGVFVIDANPEHVRWWMRQILDSCERGEKRRSRGPPSTPFSSPSELAPRAKVPNGGKRCRPTCSRIYPMLLPA